MAEKHSDDLVYVSPPVNVEVGVRRVYVLPRSLVKRIHDYGYTNGHQSEVSAVRALLESSLQSQEGGNDA